MPTQSFASEATPNNLAKRYDLARQFLSRIQKGFKNADAFMERHDIKSGPLNLRGLPEGELLLFELLIPPRLQIEGTVIGEVRNKTILLSLSDFITTLNLPITQDKETGVYTGWFTREEKIFTLDPASSMVTTEGREYFLRDDIIFRDGDVFVPLSEIEAWFSMDIDVNIGTQQLALDPAHPLPATERFERRQKELKSHRRKPPSLPRGDDAYDLFDFPHVDVNTRSTWRDRVGQKRTNDHQLNLRTAGELAYGTLKTNISANKEDKITNARASYLRESAHPELLGALKARRFELGDLSPTRIPITGSSPPETGVRITNSDPRIRQTLPSTQIAGYIFPGWDVELYRENSLLSFQETDENGYYSFDNVQLSADRNFFRVVAYGPQGEVREEEINVPYDRNRLAVRGGIYDVSLTAQDTQFYRKFDRTTPDEDTPHLVGFYEIPVGAASALQFGVRHRQEEGAQKTYASTGLSTSYAGALVNATLAGDEKGELASELVVSNQFGPHTFRGNLDLATDNYDPGQASSNPQTLSTSYNLEGPFFYKIGEQPRYAANLNYNQNANGDNNYNGFLNLNTQFQRIGVNQSLNYADNSTSVDGPNIGGTTSISGNIDNNTIRARATHNIRPKLELESLSAFWKRPLTEDLESQFQIDRTIENKLTRYSGQLNWRPEYAVITPRVSYDSEGNIEATLSTSFGMGVIPDSGDLIFTRDSISGVGTISAFVFLDKDGDMEFGGDDEPIEDASVVTPHNGNSGKTNENGYSYITALRPNIITDVYLEQSSLSDPFWVSGREGVSIMPRTGTNVSLEFPVHLAGEMDGTVYVRAAGGGRRALGGVAVRLYDDQGMLKQKTATTYDGFYLFTLVPPGKYILLVGADTVPDNIARPAPELIEIGYDGTIIYGHDITLLSETKDIPSTIMASLDNYKERHPHIEFDADPNIVLNLGSYNSNLMMSLSWFRFVRRYSAILSGGKLLVPPSKSLANIQSGRHSLRVALPTATIDEGYARCRALIAKKVSCEVEILPGSLESFVTKNQVIQSKVFNDSNEDDSADSTVL